MKQMKLSFTLFLLFVTTVVFKSSAQRIASGGNTIMYICSAGNTMGTGSNGMGQFGDTALGDKKTPVSISGLNNVMAVATGAHSLFVLSDSTVWSSGQNYSGELGDSSSNNRSTPVKVLHLTGVYAVAAGGSHSLFLKGDGTVWACGTNNNGELGDGTTTNRLVPVQVQGLTDVKAISAGTYHSLFLKKDGTVWGCGYNLYGQLGILPGSTSPTKIAKQATTLPPIKAIAAGAQFSIFISTADSMYSSGNSNYGMSAGSYLDKASTTLTNVKSAAIGTWHCAFIKNDGTAWSTGLNNHGQLGDGTRDYDVKNPPVQVLQLADVTEMAAGSFHSVFRTSNGKVYACGSNGSGQLGFGNYVDSGIVTLLSACGATTGLQTQVAQKAEINIYPNPGQGLYVIQTEREILKLSVFNAMGDEIKMLQQVRAGYTLDLTSFAKGMYFLQIEDHDHQITGKKIIFQ